MTPLHQYIYRHEGKVRDVLDFINVYITAQDNEINATIKWRVPYYTRTKHICYQNVIKEKRVELNFIRARSFSPEIQALLDFRGRKMVAGMLIESLETLNIEDFERIVAEALRVDKEEGTKTNSFW